MPALLDLVAAVIPLLIALGLWARFVGRRGLARLADEPLDPPRPARRTTRDERRVP